jgi:microcystin-dependent protein
MSNPFVAEIRIFPFNFAPTGWAFCNGQLMPISQNTALFSLLGTTYGGDGKSTFALPNLQGSVPMQQGQGPGLSLRDLGETGGEPSVTLIQTEMPAHSHQASAASDSGPTSPANNTWGTLPGRTPPPLYFNTANGPNVVMGNALSVAGGNLPHNNMQPYLALNFCIALQGVFPARP